MSDLFEAIRPVYESRREFMCGAVLLYQIFKDADGLDRVRFGPQGVDLDYLRTPEVIALYSYALAIAN